jgi:pyruvate dehydrogenase E2 component (dihydrolipoamide acetyltransferase)
MPQIGQDIQTGRIVEWAVAENQPVAKGDLLVSVESDKAVFEVEAPASGILRKILKQNGEEAEVFSPIAVIEGPGEEFGDIILNSQTVTAIEPSAEELSLVSPNSPHATIPSAPERVFASPAARRRARAEGLDLRGVPGSGPGGRVIVRDLPSFRSRSDLEVRPAQPDLDEQVFPPMRQRIAQRMILSKQSIPHFYLFRDVDCTAAAAWRFRQNEETDTRISWSDLIIKATALALREFRRLNAHVKDDRLLLKSDVNIGLAVALEDGLLVPVLPEADRLDIREISAVSRELIEAARRGIDRTSAPSTFTISNLGMCGVDRFIPIINPPECGILGVGSVQKQAVIVGGAIAVRDMVTLCLASDHRAVDGAYAAAFLNRIKTRIENPDQLEANRN